MCERPLSARGVNDGTDREWRLATPCSHSRLVETIDRARPQPTAQADPKAALHRSASGCGHCDPTVNLYDWYACIRSNRVEQLWPITARGAVY